MKTKKLVTNIISLLVEGILEYRNSSYMELCYKIQNLIRQISKMHQNNIYNKQIYSTLIDKPQYGIEQKITSKQHRLVKQQTVLINFKLIDKSLANVNFIQSWLVSVHKPKGLQKINKFNSNQELIYLLQQIIQGIKCQFLTQFQSMGQQFRSKYILDYEIEVNSKKKQRKLSYLNFQNIWKKQAFIDEQNIIKVTCYHNIDKKIQTILSQIRQISKSQSINKVIKRGSQQTKPSNSGQYQLTSSLDDNMTYQKRQRKTSMIQFYDEDLNITVLSNDSQNFKKSTGRIVNQDVLGQLQKNIDDSDGEFQLLYDEQFQKQNQTQQKVNLKIYQIQKTFFASIKDLDALLSYF